MWPSLSMREILHPRAACLDRRRRQSDRQGGGSPSRTPQDFLIRPFEAPLRLQIFAPLRIGVKEASIVLYDHGRAAILRAIVEILAFAAGQQEIGGSAARLAPHDAMLDSVLGLQIRPCCPSSRMQLLSRLKCRIQPRAIARVIRKTNAGHRPDRHRGSWQR
jgi:hypothetical protein